MKYATIKQRDAMRSQLARTRLKDLEFLRTLGLSRVARRRAQSKDRPYTAIEKALEES